jgi:hypothetical protein
MVNYIIRIELNGSPSSAAYERLHEAMRLSNTSRTIVGDDGLIYSLPHATYVGKSPLAAIEVRNMLLPDIEAIWLDCDVVVFRYDQTAWKLKPHRGLGLLAA